MPSRRFLMPRAGKGNDHGYSAQPLRQLQPGGDSRETVDLVATRTAMVDEPEAVGPAIVDAYTELARTYDQARHAAETAERVQARQLLTAEQRLRDAQARAKRQHVNLSGELHAIRCMLDRAARGHRHEPPAAIRRLEQLESRLDEAA